MHENEDEEVKVGESRIRKLLGEEQGLYQRVLQLVMADGAYCEGNCFLSLHYINTLCHQCIYTVQFPMEQVPNYSICVVDLFPEKLL